MRADPLRSLLVVSTLTMGLLLVALTVAEGSLGVAGSSDAAWDTDAADTVAPEAAASSETPAEGSSGQAVPAAPDSLDGDDAAFDTALRIVGEGSEPSVPRAVAALEYDEQADAPTPDDAGVAEGSDPPTAGAPRVARVGSREAPCGFDVRRQAVARTVTRSEPAGTTGPFEANGQPLYFFVELTNRLENRQRARVVITHVASGTSLSGNVEVGVSSRWRTWVDLIPPPSLLGPWEVRVLDSDRCLAAQFSFETIPPGWQ